MPSKQDRVPAWFVLHTAAEAAQIPDQLLSAGRYNREFISEYAQQEIARPVQTTADTPIETHALILASYAQPLPLPRNHLLTRLKSRAREQLKNAIQYRQQYGDPVQNLGSLLDEYHGDTERLQEIIDEPYG